MADHIYVTEGGYFYKMLPHIALPQQTDLFGQPLGNSKRTAAQFHGRFMGKRNVGKDYEVVLRIEGRAIIADDILGTVEETVLQSTVILNVPAAIYHTPMEVGACYIISPVTVKRI